MSACLIRKQTWMICYCPRAEMWKWLLILITEAPVSLDLWTYVFGYKNYVRGVNLALFFLYFSRFLTCEKYIKV